MVDERRIEEQENRDATIVSRIMNDKLSRIQGVENITSKRTPKYCNFDMVTTFTYKGKEHSIAIEIKERNKDKYEMIINPCSELKKEKKDKIMSITEPYDGVYYISLVNNDTAYCWDMRKTDWDNTEIFMWNIKKTQYSTNNKMEQAETYKLYWKDADFSYDIKGIINNV